MPVTRDLVRQGTFHECIIFELVPFYKLSEVFFRLIALRFRALESLRPSALDQTYLLE